MTIKAIETRYNGYKFRSRLEARWAVFFDSLGIEYRYEHEGFDVNGTWYLPDFWLPQFNCWAEVKPVTFTQEQFFLCYTIGSFLLLDGMPEIKGYFYTNFPDWDGGPIICAAAYHEYLETNSFGRVHLGQSIAKGRLWFLLGESIDDYWNEPMKKAKEVAWEASFGHGEQPYPSNRFNKDKYETTSSAAEWLATAKCDFTTSTYHVIINRAQQIAKERRSPKLGKNHLLMALREMKSNVDSNDVLVKDTSGLTMPEKARSQPIRFDKDRQMWYTSDMESNPSDSGE